MLTRMLAVFAVLAVIGFAVAVAPSPAGDGDVGEQLGGGQA